MIVLLIALGGAAGALARYGVATWAFDRWGSAFPYGTLLINIVGSFILGVVMQLTHNNANMRAALAIGFCGAFTTFSTFSYETVSLIQNGKHLAALTNVVGSLVLCLFAVYLGLVLPLSQP